MAGNFVFMNLVRENIEWSKGSDGSTLQAMSSVPGKYFNVEGGATCFQEYPSQPSSINSSPARLRHQLPILTPLFLLATKLNIEIQ